MTTCKNCTHSFMVDGNLFCRAHPPQIVMGAANGSQTTSFPGVNENMRCGEHRRWWEFWRR